MPLASIVGRFFAHSPATTYPILTMNRSVPAKQPRHRQTSGCEALNRGTEIWSPGPRGANGEPTTPL